MSNEQLIPSTVSTENTKTSVKRKPLIPKTPVDLIIVANAVAESWAKSAFRLSWLTPDALRAASGELDTAVNASRNSKSTRQPLSVDLKDARKRTNIGVSKVKYYIRSIYNKAKSESLFSEFGIEYNGKTYVFPPSGEERLKATEEMLAAVQKYDFGDREYGTVFWTEMRDSYAAMLKDARTTDSGTTQKSGEVQRLKADVTRMLKAVSSLIDAEVPDDAERTKRIWGFHREKN
jgi:hypothetical protein